MGAVAHIEDYKQGVYFRNETRGDMSWNGYEHNVLLRNLGKDEQGIPQFVDVAMALGADDIADSRGIAMLDYDNDGDLDVAVSHNPGDLYEGKGVAPALYRNDVGQTRNWLAVELVGKTCNRDAVGATVSIVAEGAKQLRLLSAGSSYASQHTDRLYFGLADAVTVERLTVRWPGGQEEHFENFRANSLIRITQGEGSESMELPAPTASQHTSESITPEMGGH